MKRMAHFSHQEHLGILEKFPDPDKRFAMVNRLKNGVTGGRGAKCNNYSNLLYG